MEKYTYQLWTNDTLPENKSALLKGLLSVLEAQDSEWQHKENSNQNGQYTNQADVLITLEDNCLTNYYPKANHFKIKVYESNAECEHEDAISSYGLGCQLTYRLNTHYCQHVASKNTPKSKRFFPSIREIYPHHDAYTLGQSIARGLTDFVTVEKAMKEQKEDPA